jgi:hypothetical protein
MEEKGNSISGLVITQTEDGYILRYKSRQFPEPIKLEDFKYIFEGNKKSRINNKVEIFLISLDSEIDLEECRKTIMDQLKKSFPLSENEFLDKFFVIN